MKYIRISGRFSAEISVLTGSDTIGNYNTHSTAKVSVEKDGTYKTYEVPVITGNSLKHWHAVYLAKVYESLGGNKLNEFCKKGIGMRGYTRDSTFNEMKLPNSEKEAIEDLCNDIHGFLIPEKQIKRDSLVKFSFGVPVLRDDVLEYVSRFSVTHNRVSPIKSKSEKGEESQMMIFKQEYSTSPLYGFAASMDLEYVMRSIYESSTEEPKEKDEVEKRKRSSILALLYMFNGVGSKQARALPISEVKELLIAVSEKQIPNLVHGAYPDYVERSLDVLNSYKTLIKDDSLKVYGYKIKCEGGINCRNSLAEIFKEILGTVT
ncbi:type I-A CRISPR-associated protein Cas7/Csa2 [Saccharolobus shibatae]|uniref:CRISPR-associated protein, Csa2 family n=1 Tax=Saccharolobus shibatae TaxID=2286 RepID=A0A8F5BVL1_9CREN|nr:type I-A CRISPR-associated protein Cas7/Csa2 [Saccharolobus shibatae]QXJ32138.1 CRISPR-associated protein, Csa2 family [Saccharolobus shibatae]